MANTAGTRCGAGYSRPQGPGARGSRSARRSDQAAARRRGGLREVAARGRGPDKRRITPTEGSRRVPEFIGNRLAHVFPICATGFKARLEFEQIGSNR